MKIRMILFNVATAMTLLTVAPVSGQSIQLKTFGLVRELEDVEIPARREGLIQELLVRRGMQVKLNERLASLASKDTQLQLDVTMAELRQAQAKARSDGQVQASRAGLERASLEMELTNELGDDAAYLERFRAQNSMKRATAELKSSLDELEQTQLMVEIKRSEALVLENDINEMLVASPVSGIVNELIKNQGEWVRKGEPILVVTRMDRLLVEGFLDSSEIAPSEVVGSHVSVEFKSGNGKTIVFEGLTVSQSAPKLELDGKFPVWVEFKNRLVENQSGNTVWMVRPGMKANMIIRLGDSGHVAHR